MSLNNGNAKASTHAEIAKLIDDYIAQGGVIHRCREGNVATTCPACGHLRYVTLEYAQSFGRRCIKCGSATAIQWT